MAASTEDEQRNIERVVLEDGEPKLTISWLRNFEDIQVEYDSAPLGIIASKRELKDGQRFTLPGGSVVYIKYHSSAFSPGFEVLKNGEHVPGSAFDPRGQTRNAGYLLYWLGVLDAYSAVYHGVFVPWPEMSFDSFLLAAPDLGNGALLATLGYFIQKKHSRVASGTAFAVVVLEFVANLLGAPASSLHPGRFLGVMVSLVFISILFKSIQATGRLADRELLAMRSTGRDDDPYRPPDAEL